MDSGLYSAYSGLRARSDMLEVLSNNLANINTTAYKTDQPFLQIFNRAVNQSQMGPLDQAINDSAVVQGSEINFSPGTCLPTGRDLDVALEGRGFLTVEAPVGLCFTRNGNLHLDGKGNLITGNGFAVLGKKGPITLPKGKVNISPAGDIEVNGVKVDTLRLADFADLKQLEKLGGSLYQTKSSAVKEQPPKDLEVRQGMLEQSNVNPILQMAQMITLTREFESLQKSIQMMMNTINENAINQVGRVG